MNEYWVGFRYALVLKALEKVSKRLLREKRERYSEMARAGAAQWQAYLFYGISANDVKRCVSDCFYLDARAAGSLEAYVIDLVGRKALPSKTDIEELLA